MRTYIGHAELYPYADEFEFEADENCSEEEIFELCWDEAMSNGVLHVWYEKSEK